MSALGAVVVLAAAGLDAVSGEPRNAFHPVAWFGRIVGVVDRDWATPRVAGLGISIALPVTAAVVTGLLVAAAGVLHPFIAAGVGALVLYVTTSRRLLVGLARRVVADTGSDLGAARESLRALAGRDAADLSPAQVRSGAVESAAENLADGLVAPLLAFLVGLPFGIPVAAGLATWVKAVNTLDSMLGYPDTPHGAASAMLDDVVMWLPARVSAVLLAVVAGRPRALASARRWLADVPSPNSGWPMGVLAAATDARLEKPGVYVLNPGAELPDRAVAERAIRLVDGASWLAIGTSAAIGLAMPVPMEVVV